MPKVCIFCGSSGGKSQKYLKNAKEVATLLCQNNFDLVYGGASVGLMGVVADTFMQNNRAVYGVIPESLMLKEIAHSGLSQLIVTKNMHDRK